MPRSLIGGCGALLLALALSAPARAGNTASAVPAPTPRRTRFAPHIVNGVLTADYPSVGVLLSPGNPSVASSVCSGTLIGCTTFLTAGHCVEGDLRASDYAVFLQHAGFFAVSSVSLHPNYNYPVADVALLKLSTAVTGIRPVQINTISAPPNGTSGTIVGFGDSGGFNQDYGLKRSGTVTTGSCTGGVSNTTSVCWHFANPLGTPGSNSNTCNGDSGGPLFIDFGSGPALAGVTSGGHLDSCLVGDDSYDANVYVYRSWIQNQGGSDLNNTACGTISQVGDADTTVFQASGQLSAGNPTGMHAFQVSSGTTLLRVTMNAIDDGFSDFDLYVKAGNPPTTADFDCRQNSRTQFGACEFANPAAGNWYALIARASGSGAYQVTATTFGGASGCGDPANNGQPCDDDNPCTQNDRCQAATCAGTAVTDGTPCDDGIACTQPDTCQAGVCIGSATPRTDCREPVAPDSGLFHLQDSTPGQPAKKDKLTWNWLKGTATTKADFGNPLASTDYDLCVYTAASGVPAVVMSEHIAPGGTCGRRACWREYASSYKYTDARLTNGPISSVLLKQGTDGKAKIVLKGKGVDLGMPTLPLNQETPVTVQLSNGGACWQAHYTSSIKNIVTEFKARAD